LPRGAQGDEAADAESDQQVPTVPEQALDLAQQLIDSGRPFAAHEVLEGMWKTCPADQRDLWRGLAQLAVGLTHLQRGNQAGAAALLRRGADRLGGYRSGRTAPDWPFGIDGPALQAAASALADDIAAASPAAARARRLKLRGGYGISVQPQS
jgi:hypothetical protein